MLKLHLIAPPFAGHLFPLLALGHYLQTRAIADIQVISTQRAQQSIALMALKQFVLLPGMEQQVAAIADPPYQVKHNPWYLLKQFEGNLALMAMLRDQLERLWQQDRPDLVIVDSVLPVAGLLAQEMGIAWWTGIASPCALETQWGTPSYLGGWKPRKQVLYHWRDALGRQLIRQFKHAVAWRYARPLTALNLKALYRENGEEVIYSPEKILAFGLEAFEFERDWPAALEFVGPITSSPPFEHQVPDFGTHHRHVLVSLGTHLPWAKDRALRLIREVAVVMPEVCFHFSYGRQQKLSERLSNNLRVYDYLPYDLYLPHVDAAIIHGGTGITYSCIRAAVPMLVWPHDYDQFDHAARIEVHQLGLRLKPRPSALVKQLRSIMADAVIQQQLKEFQCLVVAQQPLERVTALIAGLS